MSQCIILTDGGRIEVRVTDNPYCNLCGSHGEPKDVRELAFYTKHNQNLITLGFCMRHRLDLAMALLVGQMMEVPHVSAR